MRTGDGPAWTVLHGTGINAPALGARFVADVTDRNGYYAPIVVSVSDDPCRAWLTEPPHLHVFSAVAASGPWVAWISARRGDPLAGHTRLITERITPPPACR